MAEVLNRCPICGSELEYNSLYQITKVYKILKSGKLSTKPKRKEGVEPMECGFIACTNSECDFHTNCELEVEEDNRYNIYQQDSVYIIEDLTKEKHG